MVDGVTLPEDEMLTDEERNQMCELVERQVWKTSDEKLLIVVAVLGL